MWECLFLKEETKPAFRIWFKLCSCILKYTKGLWGGGLFSINSSLITLLIMFNENEKFFCFGLWFWPYHKVCRILVLQPGIKPETPAVETQSLSHWMAREVPESCLTEHFFFFLLLNWACTTFDWTVKTSEIFSEV